MIDQHGVDGAAELTLTILRKMLKNNEAKLLQEKLDFKGNDKFSVEKEHRTFIQEIKIHFKSLVV
ncbi:hypothetical protein DPX16_9606 [Anabarilius grahami]|uniref:Uncharacterized protein n=1 Tax=Anabarilius grahami TaxID=495550 RepID=A0A3N0Y8C9_ANAGA|nr:hypothetical protein DPX16_9606 [Anabarilius grahami]